MKSFLAVQIFKSDILMNFDLFKLKNVRMYVSMYKKITKLLLKGSGEERTDGFCVPDGI